MKFRKFCQKMGAESKPYAKNQTLMKSPKTNCNTLAATKTSMRPFPSTYVLRFEVTKQAETPLAMRMIIHLRNLTGINNKNCTFPTRCVY